LLSLIIFVMLSDVKYYNLTWPVASFPRFGDCTSVATITIQCQLHWPEITDDLVDLRYSSSFQWKRLVLIFTLGLQT